LLAPKCTIHLCTYVLIPSLLTAAREIALGQNLDQFRNIFDPASRVERNFITDVETSFRVAHDVHQINDPVESRGFERQDPLIVTQSKSWDCIGAHVWVSSTRYTAFRQDLTTPVVFQTAPIRAPHKRVAGNPLCRLSAHNERREVGFIPFSGPAQGIANPGHPRQLPQDPGAAEFGKYFLS